MLATLISTQIAEWNIQECCFCLRLPVGVILIGIFHAVEFIAVLTLNLLWINWSHDTQSCFGPVKVDIVDQNCTKILYYKNLPRTHHYQSFDEELMRLSAHLHDFKLAYLPTLFMVLFIHLICIATSILLIIGVLLKRKILLIPWLIIGEVIVVFYFSMSIVIIFLEANLFTSGTSVFGLFSILCLCIAFIQAYFWILVQSLYCKYDKEEMTSEEKFKMLRSDIIRDSGALVRHHNPAYPEIVNAGSGIVNAGYINDFSPHLYNNGHVQRSAYVSDTETERSIGEVYIPMTTFGKEARKRNTDDNQILDASRL